MMKLAVFAGLMPHVFAAIHHIQVGGPGGLVFDPPAIGAAVGDQVVFTFAPKAHSVTQSSFANPCGPKEGGFDSGLIPVPDNTTGNFPTWTLTVNDTNPIWAYCKAAANTANSHCGKGMVFAINCGPDGAENSFTNFRASALKIGESLAANAPASTAPTGSGAAYPAPTGPAPTQAPYPDPVTVTQVVTLEQNTWTTTYASYPNSPDPTPAAPEGVEHRVIVGGPGKLMFDPEHITAKPRDRIVFEFRQKNHTATQSSFDAPCVKKAGGFDSGYIPVAEGETNFPTWSVTVNDTAPIWVFCAQGNHCSASGMVFSVNSDETTGSPKTYNTFKQSAMSLIASNSSTPSASGATPSPSNSAMTVRTNGAILGLFVIALTSLFL